MPDNHTANDAAPKQPAACPASTCDLQPVPDLVDYLREYARQKPEVAAAWCLGVGFVLGWKLKPW